MNFYLCTKNNILILIILTIKKYFKHRVSNMTFPKKFNSREWDE